MTTQDAQDQEKYRQAFKQFNVLMVWMWRLGLRRWINILPKVIGRILVIVHAGRVTGLQRQTPVNYTIAEDVLYCASGFGSASDWYKNIQANPNVEVWLPDSWWAGVAEDVSDHPQRLSLLRQVIFDSGFAGPLFGVNPYKLDDQAFEQATSSYRLIKIQRTERLRGPGGPGGLLMFPLTNSTRR